MDEKLITCNTLREFNIIYGEPADFVACAPGRVNLIGEHTDYNDGLVLPVAIPLYTIVCGRKNDLNLIRIRTLSQDVGCPNAITVDLCITKIETLTKGSPKWGNYILGVIRNFKSLNHGFDAVINSNIPRGAGLSSSASLEVAFFTFMEAMTGKSVSSKDKILACQKAEHEFADVPCGIMDQSIACMGKKDNALLLDCKTNETKLVPIDEDVKIVVIDSKVKHDLASSCYAERRNECSEAASLLEVESLRDATQELVNELSKSNTSVIQHKRAKHVTSENKRTLGFIDAMQNKDFVRAGQLMIESHKSLRDDFEVSCIEVDEIVNTCINIEGVYGSRMTGGGFGGCVVSLVKHDAVDNMEKEVKASHPNLDFYVFIPCDGAKILQQL